MVAEHWYLLYKMDKQGANLKFIYWWEDKVSGVWPQILPSIYYSHLMIQFCRFFLIVVMLVA